MGGGAPLHPNWPLLLLLAGFLTPCIGSYTAPRPWPVLIQGVASINATFAIASTDDPFVCATLDWWPPDKCDYGTCSWGLSSLINLNLSSHILLNAVKAFAPLKLRIGGTLQDKVLYETGDLRKPCTSFVKNASEMFGFTQGCLPLRRWDLLNEFFKLSGVEVIFGLNALNGRVPMPDGSLGGPWNHSNAESFIRYTVNRGYTIHGWELGNELSGSGIGTRVYADQYADDVIALKSIIDDIYKGFPTKPTIIAPGGFFDANWFRALVDKTSPKYALGAISHHIYNLGPGVDDNLISKILDPSYLDGEASTFSCLQNILISARTSTVAWVSEAGGAYNSGRNLVSNAFVYSFWYLDQLGMASTYDTKTYCRQSLIGGNYGLLNTLNFKPNPDYYSALLWHRLMGRRVLSTKFYGTNKIRAYAHCAKQSQGITLLLINLDGNTTTRAFVANEGDYINRSKKHHNIATRARPNHLHRLHPRSIGFITRDEYHLTAKNGSLQSQAMMLNGKELELGSAGEIPSIRPIKVHFSLPVIVAPFSIVFVHLPYFHAPACL